MSFKANEHVMDCAHRREVTLDGIGPEIFWVIYGVNAYDLHKSELSALGKCESCADRLECLIRGGLNPAKWPTDRLLKEVIVNFKR